MNTAPNRELATRIAEGLPGTLPLPPEATEVSTDPSAGKLAQPFSYPATPQLVSVHRFWRLSGTPSAAIKWLEAHPPSGSKITMGGTSGVGDHVTAWDVGYTFPPVPGRISSEELQVTVTQAEGAGTALLADGQVVWVIPRPASERIPGGVRVIDVTASDPPRHIHFAGTIKSAAAIRRIVTLIEGLERPGEGARHCPAFEGATVELGSGVRRGARLLRVSVRVKASAKGSRCGCMASGSPSLKTAD